MKRYNFFIGVYNHKSVCGLEQKKISIVANRQKHAPIKAIWNEKLRKKKRKSWKDKSKVD